MLERGEQRVELGKMGAVVGFELVDLGDAGGEGALEIERRKRTAIRTTRSSSDLLTPAMTRLDLNAELCQD